MTRPSVAEDVVDRRGGDHPADPRLEAVGVALRLDVTHRLGWHRDVARAQHEQQRSRLADHAALFATFFATAGEVLPCEVALVLVPAGAHQGIARSDRGLGICATVEHTSRRSMILNAFEKLMMNNPVRAEIQRRFEASRLRAMGGTLSGGHALEVGCGRGVGTEIVLRQFGADRVDAFDLDADMVARAQRRLGHYGDRVRVWTGDVTAIAAADATYDAVFDFGIVHHVPDWRAALREIHRVLRPGGRLFAEEVLARFIEHPLWRALLDHPRDDRFDAPTFLDALAEAGFEVVDHSTLWGQFAWFVADKPDA